MRICRDSQVSYDTKSLRHLRSATVQLAIRTALKLLTPLGLVYDGAGRFCHAPQDTKMKFVCPALRQTEARQLQFGAWSFAMGETDFLWPKSQR